jgi:dTDP-4-amino-4,6-dideoxygalactose transaminase
MAVSSLSKPEALDRVSPIEFIDLKAQQARIRVRVDAAIGRVLDHGQYIMGPEVFELEAQLAARAGAKHAISCASGTDALLIAMMAKGIGPGDAVLCPDFTYTATPETIALLGATPVFVDVRSNTFNIDPAGIEAGLGSAKRLGLVPKGLIAVDLFGLAADYDAIRPIAARHGLFMLADAAQSFGASYKGQAVGSLGDITTTSFFPAKPLGCYGDGGAIFTNDDDLADIMTSIRLHGKGRHKYDIVRIGVNGRLDTIQAAVLIEKLTIFDDEIDRRNEVAARYTSALGGRVIVPEIPAGSRSVWAHYTVRLPTAERDRVMLVLANQGIPANIYYPRAVHEQTAYRDFPVAGNGTPNATRLPREVLSLPMHAYLSAATQDRIIAAVLNAI